MTKNEARSNLDALRRRNPALRIESTESEAFKAYGAALPMEGLEELTRCGASSVAIPASGNEYLASVPALEALGAAALIEDQVYGQLPIQAGSCAGQNSVLNGFEYHQGSETIIALTDCVLILGKRQDMKGLTYDASLVEYFFLEASREDKVAQGAFPGLLGSIPEVTPLE